MVREHGWFSLSAVEQRALPQAAEMFEIEAQIDDLCEGRERRLRRLSELKAQDMPGVVGKLAVAARLLEDEQGHAYRLVADALNELALRGADRQ